MNLDQSNSCRDAELLDLIRMGDSAAFREIYEKHWSVLLNMSYKRLDRIEIAEEVVQDIFVNLFLRRAELEVRTSLEAYLKTALKYKIFDVFRSMASHARCVDALVQQQHLTSLHLKAI
ncbi:RNA polymerase sigma factor [Pedobacter frigoris]|uniref:RNA polymerase sigma factor n=1 Tax=Pedobacter frigoris TaxID=2571272 RepID=UPI00292FA607|nr:sigma factor [Pedobacter frigoris]